MFSNYKDIFGKPNEGIHSYRIFNIAILDVLMTIVGAYLICLINSNYNFFTILLILFLLGIIFHHIFGVKTTINKIIFKYN